MFQSEGETKTTQSAVSGASKKRKGQQTNENQNKVKKPKEIKTKGESKEITSTLMKSFGYSEDQIFPILVMILILK